MGCSSWAFSELGTSVFYKFVTLAAIGCLKPHPTPSLLQKTEGVKGSYFVIFSSGFVIISVKPLLVLDMASASGGSIVPDSDSVSTGNLFSPTAIFNVEDLVVVITGGGTGEC